MLQHDAQTIVEAPAIVAAPARKRIGRLLTTAGVIYLTAILLLLIDPQPVQDWLDDLEPSPVVAAAQFCMGVVAPVSEALGLSAISRTVRSRTVGLLRRPDATAP